MKSPSVNASLVTRWQELVRQAQSSPTYGLEGLLLSITERVCEAMEEQGVTRSRLAERLGVSKPWVTKFLSGNRNLTLKSWIRVANALNLDIEIAMPRKATNSAEVVATLPSLDTLLEQQELSAAGWVESSTETLETQLKDMAASSGGDDDYALAA